MDPKSLGISAPAGRDVYEVYLKVKSRPSILGKISDIMKQRNIDILGANAQVSDDKQTAYIALYIEMAGSTTSIEETVETLREQDYVLEATSESRRDTHYESMMFPLTSGGHYRTFVVGGTAWAALSGALLQTFGSGGEAILFNEGRSAGADIVAGIAKDRRFEGRTPTRELLLANLVGLFRASGFGILEVARDDKGDFKIRIKDSVLSGGEKPVVDHFLVGLAAGGVGSVYRLSLNRLAVNELKLDGSVVEFRLVGDWAEGEPTVSK